LLVGRHPLSGNFLPGAVFAGKCEDWHGLVSPRCHKLDQFAARMPWCLSRR
jgi:hypothetical protein